jgi:hypothetical protein
MISINKRDGVHSGQLLSLAITKQILIDTYSECYNIEQHCEIVQLAVEEEELLLRSEKRRPLPQKL